MLGYDLIVDDSAAPAVFGLDEQLSASGRLDDLYAERHDPANRPIVSGGPLLKINANQRSATAALGAAE